MSLPKTSRTIVYGFDKLTMTLNSHLSVPNAFSYFILHNSYFIIHLSVLSAHLSVLSAQCLFIFHTSYFISQCPSPISHLPSLSAQCSVPFHHSYFIIHTSYFILTSSQTDGNHKPHQLLLAL